MYATLEEVLGRWLGGDTPDLAEEGPALEILILDVCDEINRLIPTLEARVASGEVKPRSVSRVVAHVVQRIWKVGGTPFSSGSNTAGQFSTSWSMPQKIARSFKIMPEEIESLQPTKKPLGMMITLGTGDASCYSVHAHGFNLDQYQGVQIEY